MDSKYLRVPQDVSDLSYLENEKDRIGHRPHWVSRNNLFLMFSMVANAVLSLSLLMLLREKPTPTGFGERKQAISVTAD